MDSVSEKDLLHSMDATLFPDLQLCDPAPCFTGPATLPFCV